MRVLWFTNTPSLATEPLTGKPTVGGGWIESLEKKMLEMPNVQMAVAYPLKGDKVHTIELGQGRYYGIPAQTPSRIQRWRERHLAELEPRDRQVGYYLEIVEDFKPDVIHVFGSERAYGLMIPLLKVPALVWIQGNLTVYAKMWFSDLTREDVKKYSKPQSFINGLSWVHKYRRAEKVAAREREIFAYCKHFTGRTPWDRRLAATLSPGANYYHCDEVMRDPFYTAQWAPHHDRDKYVFFTTIRGNIYKGLKSLYETAAVLKRVLDKPFEWRLAGINPQNELAHIVEKKLGYTQKDVNLNLMGNKNPFELVSELQHADIFIHPSHIDNSPNSVCEAMMVGTPTISTNVGGIPGLMEEGVEGLMVQPGDPFAMAGAIMDLIYHPAKAQAISEQARKRGLYRNDPDRIAADLMNIYEHVLTDQSTPAYTS